MADFIASTGFQNMLADSAAGYNYYVTLHDATGGFAAGDTYSAGIHGELADSVNGYSRGAKTLALTNGGSGVLDGADVIWTANGGELTAAYAAIWASTGTITGAILVSVEDASASPQTATDGNDMTLTITNPITIQVPA